MTREILSGNASELHQPGLPEQARLEVPIKPSATKDVAHPADALAAAFPEWDLLPGTQFIRRVK
ncbi:hypothetical protein [Noviherbaspirillum pedocola]|uniref:Uncharacterized protein n=1 Tax=Noviherbaspirillum pedocola TaxID=2801341 RepID=A0A934STN4_9BURK|nr:hypothetical protein [Noviherbaspirillum pedocola]MBK4735245.1 hypothetical protein [Noviherbaspirillum pedocola]